MFLALCIMQIPIDLKYQASSWIKLCEHRSVEQDFLVPSVQVSSGLIHGMFQADFKIFLYLMEAVFIPILLNEIDIAHTAHNTAIVFHHQKSASEHTPSSSPTISMGEESYLVGDLPLICTF